MEDKRICPLVRELLPQYDAGVCSEEVRAEIDEHLKECDECNQAYADVHASAKELEIEQFIKKRKKRKLLDTIALGLAAVIAVGAGIRISLHLHNIPVIEVHTSPADAQGYLIQKGDEEGQTVRLEYEIVWEQAKDEVMRLNDFNLKAFSERDELLFVINLGENEEWFPVGQLPDGTTCTSLMTIELVQRWDEHHYPVKIADLYATENMESFLLNNPGEYLLVYPSEEDWQAYNAVHDFVELFDLYPLIVSPQGSSIYDAMLQWEGGIR